MYLGAFDRRLFLRWMLPGLLGGLVVGSGATWWLAGRGMDAEVERRLRMQAQSAARPRMPGVGSGSEAAGSAVRAGGSWSAVPRIEVTDNLESACASLLAIKDPALGLSALKAFVERLPRERWGSFLLAMKALGDRGEFEDQPGSFVSALGMMESTLSLMTQRAPLDLLMLVRETRDGEETNDNRERDEGTANLVFRFWAGHDFDGALAHFETEMRSLPPDQQREAAAGLAREYMKKDPAAALAWIKGLPEETRGPVAHAAFQTLSHVDSEAALRLLLTEKDLPGRDGFAEQMAKGWAATKPEEALAWAKGLPEELAAHAVGGAMEHLVQKDIAAALRETATLPPSQQDAALAELAGGINDDDPGRVDQVLKLVEAAPEGPGRAEAARSALEEWTTRDVEAASAWVAAQPEGETRDAAIEGFGESAVASKKAPDAGLEWSAAISSPGERSEVLRNNIEAWASYDAAAARAWVQSSARLSEGDREVLLPLTRK